MCGRGICTGTFAICRALDGRASADVSVAIVASLVGAGCLLGGIVLGIVRRVPLALGLQTAGVVLLGVAGVVLSRTNEGARVYLIGGGVVYLVLWLFGLVIDKTSDANFVPLNSADDWLHFVLGVGMIGLGVVLSRNLRTSRSGRV